jgi:hypothetical protein
MARKKAKIEEEGGPTVNGHPVLSVNDVIGWFQKYDCNVSEQSAIAIAQVLNQYEFLAPLWKDTPELRAKRRKNVSVLRNFRIADAIRTLQKDLPSLLDDARRVVPPDKLGALHPLESLLVDINSIASRFNSTKSPGRGRTPKTWHTVARKVGALIVDALRASNGRRAGLGKATSPAVKITRKALAYLGVNATPTAIVDAVRHRRVRRPKRVGK